MRPSSPAPFGWKRGLAVVATIVASRTALADPPKHPRDHRSYRDSWTTPHDGDDDDDNNDDRYAPSFETETVAFFGQEHPPPHPYQRPDSDENAQSPFSSLCFPVLFNGGGGPSFLISTSSSNSNVMEVEGYYRYEESDAGRSTTILLHEEEEEDEDDDDDDDDDDGHGMMLSNASLRRSIAVSSSGDTVVHRNDNGGGNDDAGTTRPKPNRRGDGARPSSESLRLLRLRGGQASTTAVPVDLGGEVARRLLTTALVTLLYEAAVGHVLEALKIRMQTTVGDDVSYARVIKDATAERGLVGLWDGFLPWGAVQASVKGGAFGFARATVKGALSRAMEDPTSVLATTIAGGLAGGCQGYALSPLLLLKTRVVTSAEASGTIGSSLAVGTNVVRREGVGALFKGAHAFALKRVLDWSTRFWFADTFARALSSLSENNVPLSTRRRVAADLLGGVASTVVTLPLDVLVSKSQDAKRSGEEGDSAWRLFREELDELGWAGLRRSYLRGFEARLAHVCLTTVVMKTGTGLVYDALYGN